MNRHLPLITGLAGMGLLIIAAAETASAGPRSQARVGSGRLVLTQIDELRRVEVVKHDEAFTFDLPGLELSFEIELPQGRRVVEVQEPASLRATDSTGRDLTQIEENMFGRRQFIHLYHIYGESPKELKFGLALPDRDATSFNISATIDVLTDTGARDATLELGPNWTALDPKLFGGTAVKARLRQGQHDIELELQPGTVRTMIESAQLTGDGVTLDSYSSMWSDAALGYSFQGRLSSAMKATLKLRKGLKTIPMEIDLKAQPLP